MRAHPLVVFGLIHAVVFLLIFAALGQLFYFGLGVLEHFVAVKMLDGQMPYVDFPSEYPPLALLSFLLPALFFRAPLSYSWAFAVEMLVLDLAALALIAALATRLKLSAWHTLAVYTLFIIALGPIMVSRYDLLPAVLVLAALYALATGRNKSAWALLALGIGAKLYPIIIAPIFALYYLRQRQYRRLIVGSATLLGVLLVLALPWLLHIPDLAQLGSYHAERGLHSESTYGSLLLVGQVFKLTEVEGGLTFGSWNLSSPLADKLAALSPYITAILLLLVYIRYGRLLWRPAASAGKLETPDQAAIGQMLSYSLLAITTFLLGNKVFSPQYLVWLGPLLPLVMGRRHYLLWLCFVLAGALTQYLYPYHYIEFELGQPYLLFLLLVRNLLMVSMAVLLVLPRRAVAAPS